MRNKFRMALLALATVGLFSCSDKLADDVTPSEDGTTGYVAFKISTVTDVASARGSFATRADGDVPDDDKFDSGDEEEYAISDTKGANIAFFYAADGTYHSSSLLEKVGGPSDSSESDHNSAEEKVYQAHIKEVAGKEIRYCLLVLNGNPAQLETLKGNLAETKKQIEETYLGWEDAEHEYFTMTNTVYVKKDDTVQTETVIDPFTQIRSTLEEAANNPIVVHVERVLAKFTLIFGDDSGEKKIIDDNGIINPAEGSEYITFFKDRTANDDFTFESVKWRVAVKGWDVNATETQTYFFKQLDDGTDTWKNAWKYRTWYKDWEDEEFGWNDITRLRSYWAVDPHYNVEDGNKYPYQFRQADGVVYGDNEDGTYKEVKAGLPLKYQSYTYFSGQTGVISARYAVENTFDYGWMSADDYKRTGTHIIIAAELETQQSNGTWAPQTLYNYNGFYWKATNEGMSDDLKEYMLKRVLAEWKLEKGELYKNNVSDESLLEGTLANFEDYFTIVPATVKNGDGRVMMQLNEDGKHTLYKKNDREELTPLTADELKEFKDVYLKGFGTARRFNKGEMYYPIFIRHMVTPSTNEYKVGSYGVVRNHWYRATITAIKNPGVPVDKPDQPIIPNDDPDAEGYVSFEIVIIPWHLIDWEVEL